jgi:hypothetical protein
MISSQVPGLPFSSLPERQATPGKLAVDLAAGRARRTFLSIRPPTNIQRRAVLGLSTQVLGLVLRPLPVPLVDSASLLMQSLAVGDLAAT